MPGATTAVQMHPSEIGPDGRVYLKPADPAHLAGFAKRPRGGLLLGAGRIAEGNQLYAINARSALRGSSISRVNIPPAYELDDLTFGALWAVANLDDALLADDLALSESLPKLTAYDRLDSSSVSGPPPPS
jgi:hypothetical protein